MGKAAFQRFFEKYVWNSAEFTLEDPNRIIDGKTVTELFGGRKTSTGQHVSQDSAFRFSAVWAANRLLSAPFSYFPIKLYRKTSSGREEVLNHPILTALRNPNSYTSKTVLFDRSCTHLNMWGNTYLEPWRKGGKVVGFELHHPDLVDPKSTGEGRNRRIVYDILSTDKAKKIKTLDSDEILHIPGLGDGITGKSVVRYAAEDIGLEFAIQEYGGTVYRDGGDPRGMYSVKAELNPSQMKDVEERVKEQLRRSRNLVVGADATYTPFNMSPVDAEFIASRHFNVSTIARWFGVPAWKLAEHSDGSSTFNNIEHMGISFLQDSLAPIVSKYEDEFNRKIFLDSESDLYLEWNMDAYLRADSKSQAEQFRTGIQNAYYSPNEVRKLKNLNPVEGGDELFIQKNMIALSQAKNNINGKELVPN